MEKYFDEAAKYLGKSVLDLGHHTRQALILSDGNHISKFTLGSINRNINSEWKKEIKKVMTELYDKKERTTLIACIDVRYINAAIEDPDAASDFKAIILDGQHRLVSLRDLIAEDPKYKTYEFWVVLYIIQNDDEMLQLLKDMDKRIMFDQQDVSTIDIRMKFIKVFKELCQGQESRRCVTGTINHPILRDINILNEIKKYRSEELKTKIKNLAKTYKPKFELAKLSKCALYDTIQATNLYQLIDWQSGLWIRELFV
jgi:hypothetical protein